MAFFMQSLDTTILNTALPAMAADLHRSPLAMQSAIISYALTVALLIPISGWLADRFGTRRIFILSVALFSFGSLLCALSTTLPMLVTMRVLQGIGGAMMMPVARLVLLKMYARAEFLAVMSLVSMPGLIGPVLGPLLGGWLVTVASWHWIFLINLPVGLVGIALALRIMPDLRSPHVRFDWSGFSLFGVGLVLLSLGLDLLGEPSIGMLSVLGSMSVGILLLAVYVRHARLASSPLFDLRLLRIRTFGIGFLGNIVSRLGTGGIALLLPLMLQVSFGYSAAVSGWMLAPVALAALAVKPLITTLIPRLGYRRILLATGLITALAVLLFTFCNADTPLPWILPALILFGAVNSMQLTAMNTLTLCDLPPHYTSMGNSLYSVAQQLSVSFGIAVAATSLQLFRPAHVASGPGLTPAFHHTFMLLAIETLLSCVIFMRLRPGDGDVQARPIDTEH
jgi:EmrB/QacA subfamily drug resistance transporter